MQSATLFGEIANQILIYLNAFEQGYAAGMARFYALSLSGVQRQLTRLESGGVLVSRLMGTVRIYSWNPRLYAAAELRAYLNRVFDALPASEQQRYYAERRRPRRRGKPLKNEDT